MSIDPVTLVLLVIGGIVVYGVWTAIRPNWPIRIVVTRDGVQSHQGLPKRCTLRVIEFLERDIAVESRLVILARREQNGRLRTSVRGELDKGTQQRIRNYLIAEL